MTVRRPERDVLDRLVERLDVLTASLREDLAWLGDVPGDPEAFDALPSHRRSASRAALKSFEEIQDQLARAFCAIPVLVGQDTNGWFAARHGRSAGPLKRLPGTDALRGA